MYLKKPKNVKVLSLQDDIAMDLSNLDEVLDQPNDLDIVNTGMYTYIYLYMMCNICIYIYIHVYVYV